MFGDILTVRDVQTSCDLSCLPALKVSDRNSCGGHAWSANMHCIIGHDARAVSGVGFWRLNSRVYL